jgi:hypothetical protein
LTFYPPKKVAPPLIRVEKNFLQIVRKGYQKEQNFTLISKVLSLSKEEKIVTENIIFWGLDTLCAQF